VAEGVTLIGAANLASSMPAGASTAYARNIAAFIAHIVHDGSATIDPADEIVSAMLVSHAGAVVSPAVAATRSDPSHDSAPGATHSPAHDPASPGGTS
jgi:proton-translocating NAD(P)+ transhydrogenase subunit alpha